MKQFPYFPLLFFKFFLLSSVWHRVHPNKNKSENMNVSAYTATESFKGETLKKKTKMFSRKQAKWYKNWKRKSWKNSVCYTRTSPFGSTTSDVSFLNDKSFLCMTIYRSSKSILYSLYFIFSEQFCFRYFLSVEAVCMRWKRKRAHGINGQQIKNSLIQCYCIVQSIFFFFSFSFFGSWLVAIVTVAVCSCGMKNIYISFSWRRF